MVRSEHERRDVNLVLQHKRSPWVTGRAHLHKRSPWVTGRAPSEGSWSHRWGGGGGSSRAAALHRDTTRSALPAAAAMLKCRAVRSTRVHNLPR